MTRTLLLGMAVIAALVVAPRRATAQVQRYAVLIGNNSGYADEARLAYAEADARKVEGVLRDLGGFAAENITTLDGATPDAVRRALIAVNDRIRGAHGDTLLFVYYSGHADADGLHLGRASLPHDEITKLVRGSPATIRLLVLDSCRSGAATRTKGGKAVAAFDLGIDERLAGEGAIFLSSSAGDEDSQESDELKGSFFTHYLVSGLLGAADVDRDGAVALDEAYRYAYDNTLRASSRTAAGLQHPTFEYDVAGHGKIVLTRPGAAKTDRGRVTFPGGRAYLLFAGSSSGGVVAEVGASDSRRTLSVKAGTYFVRGRSSEHLLEGAVEVVAGRELLVSVDALDKVQYARLVRKGSGPNAIASALTLGALGHSDLANAGTVCTGAALGYRLELRTLSFVGRVAGCAGGYDYGPLRTSTTELDASLGAVHVWDVAPFSVEAGVAAGGAWLHQTYETAGVAPSRDALAFHLDVLAGAALDVGERTFVTLGARAQTYFLRRQAADEPAADAELEPVFVVGAEVAIGWRF